MKPKTMARRLKETGMYALNVDVDADDAGNEGQREEDEGCPDGDEVVRRSVIW